MTMLVIHTKRFILVVALLVSGQFLFAANKADSAAQNSDRTLSNVDSLKKLQVVVPDSLKGQLYTEIAGQYLQYDNIADKRIKLEYQEAALRNTYIALHYFSRYADTTGLRISFDNLAKIYHAQKKYPQAKWFILQSNTLARAKNDDQNTIASLIELASIKADIKDYSLAMRDLNEALSIASKMNSAQQESQVQLSYAMLYTSMNNTAKADIAMKRHLAIDDSIKKAEEATMLAQQKRADSAEQAKKKEGLTLNKRPYDYNSLGKTDSSQSLLLSSY